MTSTVRSCDLRRGFSLLEIVIVLLISSLVLGGAIGLMTYSSDEQVLKKTMSEVEVLAKRARASAILHQTPYALVIRQGGLELMPWVEASGGFTPTDRVSDHAPAHVGMALAQDVKAELRRWNAVNWQLVGKDAVLLWRFDPNGLCEPISLRFSLGKSWVAAAFHPLTAVIREFDSETR